MDYEEELYHAIAYAIYEPVNQAASVLGFPLVYTMSRGMLFGDNVVSLLPVNVLLHPTIVFSSMWSLCLHELTSTASIQHGKSMLHTVFETGNFLVPQAKMPTLR